MKLVHFLYVLLSFIILRNSALCACMRAGKQTNKDLQSKGCVPGSDKKL